MYWEGRQRRVEADSARKPPGVGGPALGIDALDAQIRQVFFFDTPNSTSTLPASSFGPVGVRTTLVTWSRSDPWTQPSFPTS